MENSDVNLPDLGMLMMTTEELKEADSEEITEQMSAFNKFKDSIKAAVVKLQTQKDEANKRLTEIKESVKKEFGVDTPEELEALKQENIESIDKLQKEFEEILKEGTPNEG